MATYRLTAPWVPAGPGGGAVLPPGTLVGDGTPYPVKDAKTGLDRPPAASEKVDTPPPGKPGNAEKADPGPLVIDPSKEYKPGVSDAGKALGLKATAPASKGTELGLADKADEGPAKASTMKGSDK